MAPRPFEPQWRHDYPSKYPQYPIDRCSIYHISSKRFKELIGDPIEFHSHPYTMSVDRESPLIYAREEAYSVNYKSQPNNGQAEHKLCHPKSKRVNQKSDNMRVCFPPVFSCGDKQRKQTSHLSAAKVPSTATSLLKPQLEKGLRYFSMKICEKVKGKGTTSYNEVADELVRELREVEALSHQESYESGVSTKKKRIQKDTPPTSSYDEKNIRRRVYDTLNVLMAVDIIIKDKKLIVWNGFPGEKCPKGQNNSVLSEMNVVEENSVMSKRLLKLEEKRANCQAQNKRKRECLQELIAQCVSYDKLIRRNHARVMARDDLAVYQDFKVSQLQQKESPQDFNNYQIPLPFIVVNTSPKADIQCEICPDRTNVAFDFSLPFEVNDDNEILKKIGLKNNTIEELQQILPFDIFNYCERKGLIKNLINPPIQREEGR